MNDTNEMLLEFESKSQNESFARTVVAAFAAQLDPTIEELADIKTAVSEAVTNSIIHGYVDRVGIIKMRCIICNNEITVEIQDSGVGIENIAKAMEPLYTTRPELERSGMGFSFMEAFMDELAVESNVGKGTVVRMKKRVGKTDKLKGYTQEANQKA
jgi:stage II sporulation protein AB (anti-sigma F factor)